MSHELEYGEIRNFAEGGEIPENVIKREAQIARRQLVSFKEKMVITNKYLRILRSGRTTSFEGWTLRDSFRLRSR